MPEKLVDRGRGVGRQGVGRGGEGGGTASGHDMHDNTGSVDAVKVTVTTCLCDLASV